MCVCVCLHISTSYIKLKQQESFFCLLAMHTVHSSTCWVSVFRSWHFQYKIFTLLLVILMIITVPVASYGFEYSEHMKNGIRMTAPFLIITRGDKGNYTHCWKIRIVCWNTEEGTLCPVTVKQLVVELLNNLLPESRRDTRYVKEELFTTVPQSKKIGRRWPMFRERHWLICSPTTPILSEWLEQNSKETEVRSTHLFGSALWWVEKLSTAHGKLGERCTHCESNTPQCLKLPDPRNQSRSCVQLVHESW